MNMNTCAVCVSVLEVGESEMCVLVDSMSCWSTCSAVYGRMLWTNPHS